MDFSKTQIRALIVPLIFEQLLAFLVGLADTVMVAGVGNTAVSAVSLVDSFFTLIMVLFSALAVTKGFWTMLLAHIMFCTPFVILSVMPKLRTLDPNLTDAALDLGCTPFQAMLKVIIPQIKPSIIAGALIAFTMSFDDFVISYFVTGNGVQNISILVYTMSKRINPSINALSSLVILIITVSLIAVNLIPLIKRKATKKHG